ncbi:MAG: hypothetical protein RJA44_2654 [Pseudomonadota bacterium]
MAQDIHSVRRRAAVAVLADVLDNNALVEALWLQQETMRGENVSDIIGFIDAVGKRNLLDAGVQRRLYTDLHKAMRLPEDKLPADPWPAMQAQRAASSRAAAPVFTPVAAPAPYAPAYAAPAAYAPPAYAPPAYAPPAPMPIPAPVPVSAPARPPVPPEQPLVFGALMRAALQEVQRFHRDAFEEVRRDALLELERSQVPIELRPEVREAWSRGASHHWQMDRDLQMLGELVRVLHLALISAFGRVGADQILSRAVQTAELLPESQRYSPKRLLTLL